MLVIPNQCEDAADVTGDIGQPTGHEEASAQERSETTGPTKPVADPTWPRGGARRGPQACMMMLGPMLVGEASGSLPPLACVSRRQIGAQGQRPP